MTMTASNDIMSNPANFTTPMRASRFYAAKQEGGNWLSHEKCRILVVLGVRSRQMVLLPEF